jgi:hypothetical protein
MLRTVLGLVILLALPTLLAAQEQDNRQSGSSKSTIAHGVAMDVQGEVVAGELDGQNNHEGLNESNGDNNQEGIDEQDGPNDEVVGDEAGEDQGSAATSEGEDQGSTAEQNTHSRHKP